MRVRAISINPETHQVAEVMIEASSEARRNAVGDSCETAMELGNGDVLLVGANGHSRHQKFFDVGASQPFAGPGLIVGGPGHRDAKISLAEVVAMTTWVADYTPSLPKVRDFADMSEAFAYLAARGVPSADRPAASDPSHGLAIELHYSLLDVEDADLAVVETGGWPDWTPCIEMFPESGLVELVTVPTEEAYRITSEGVRWIVPYGVLAETLKISLLDGGPLYGGLCKARAAALADVGVLAACHAVVDDLDRLSATRVPPSATASSGPRPPAT